MVIASPDGESTRWSVGAGQFLGVPAIVRTLDLQSPVTKLPTRLGFALPHGLTIGTEGMQHEHDRLQEAEERLEVSLVGHPCILVAVLTTPSVREFIFYVESKDAAERCAIAATQIQPILQYYVEEDPKWDLYTTLCGIE
jgi:hypothetical protein